MRKAIVIVMLVLVFGYMLVLGAQTVVSNHWMELVKLAAPIEWKVVDDAGAGDRAFYFRINEGGDCFRVPEGDLFHFLDNSPSDWSPYLPYMESRHASPPADFAVHCPQSVEDASVPNPIAGVTIT